MLDSRLLLMRMVIAALVLGVGSLAGTQVDGSSDGCVWVRPHWVLGPKGMRRLI